MADKFTFQVPGKKPMTARPYVFFALLTTPETVVAQWDPELRVEIIGDAQSTETIINILKDQIRLLEEEHAMLSKPPVVN